MSSIGQYCIKNKNKHSPPIKNICTLFIGSDADVLLRFARGYIAGTLLYETSALCCDLLHIKSAVWLRQRVTERSLPPLTAC